MPIPAVAPALTPAAKRRRFAELYVETLNAAEAAKGAGYCEKFAKQVAYKLLRQDDVKAYVSLLEQQREEGTRLRRARVLEELAAVALSNVNDFIVDDAGNLALAPGAHPDAMKAVASVKRTVDVAKNGTITRRVEFRLWDKNAALANALKHLGLLIERVEVKANIEVQVEVAAVRQRVARQIDQLAERRLVRAGEASA